MIVEKILNNEEILSKYAKIDEINPYPFNHGMKHIKNAVALVDEIAKSFRFNERDVEILKVCEVLHDLGQVDGRENHGLKAAVFAKNFLKQYKYFSNEEISLMVSAIETHDEKDFSKLKNKYSWFANFIDKMDFSRYRLEDDSEEKFGYIEYNDIEKITFDKNGNEFKIEIHSIENPKIIGEEALFSHPFFNKVVYTAENFCKHFGLNLKIYLDGKILDLSKVDNK